jgi:hypothetical protein
MHATDIENKQRRYLQKVIERALKPTSSTDMERVWSLKEGGYSDISQRFFQKVMNETNPQRRPESNYTAKQEEYTSGRSNSRYHS